MASSNDLYKLLDVCIGVPATGSHDGLSSVELRNSRA